MSVGRQRARVPNKKERVCVRERRTQFILYSLCPSVRPARCPCTGNDGLFNTLIRDPSSDPGTLDSRTDRHCRPLSPLDFRERPVDLFRLLISKNQMGYTPCVVFELYLLLSY